MSPTMHDRAHLGATHRLLHIGRDHARLLRAVVPRHLVAGAGSHRGYGAQRGGPRKPGRGDLRRLAVPGGTTAVAGFADYFPGAGHGAGALVLLIEERIFS